MPGPGVGRLREVVRVQRVVLVKAWAPVIAARSVSRSKTGSCYPLVAPEVIPATK